ncbi:MAG: hypothetical protein ACI927_001155 [Oceanospirillaceae bacterium]|jgi:hypothetical protein|tara:strand:- start:39 stop:143 length:105 start_codon:yes stop_codon:yes gene_type:complete
MLPKIGFLNQKLDKVDVRAKIILACKANVEYYSS